MLRFITIALMVFTLTSCDNHLTKDPGQHNFTNGDIALINNNKVTIFDKKGHMIQQSIFTKPTFIEARGFLVDIQQDLMAKNYSDFLQGDVDYPLHVYQNGKRKVYKNSEQLQKNFKQVFSKNILDAIIAQDPYRLFAHNDRISIDGGKVWFNKKGIYVVNKTA